MNKTVDYDFVNKPKHYNSHPSGVEAREIAEHLNSNLGQALNYVFRHKLKGEAKQDIKKAVLYLTWEIERIREAGSERVLVQPLFRSEVRELLKRVYGAEGLTIIKLFYKVLFNVIDTDDPSAAIRYLEKMIEQLNSYKKGLS